MENQQQTACAVRRAQALLGLTALLSVLGACAKIVGIEDTTVTRGDGMGGDENAGNGSNSAGAAHAGAANAGHANGGTTNTGGNSAGGATANAGADTSDAGSNAAGGLVNQAGSTSNAGSAGTSECPCSAPKPTCENGKCVVRGPTMAKATTYYIDSTEVSKAQYDVFLAAKANGTDTSGQRAECSWNKSYVPGAAVDDPRPIVNVDWCDAAAYCAWADKRLCGAIAGGPLGELEVNDVTKSQMYLACGGAGEERYPYGGFTYQAGYCNFGDYMADVGQHPQCEGHYDGIFDLIGNAAEWIDACDTTGGADRALDNCYLGGGSYIKNDYKCETYFPSARNTAVDLFGFRCCSK